MKEHLAFKKQDIVHYHPVIGQPHDGKEYEIVDFGSINGDRDVCWLFGKRGCVSTKAISHARCPGCGKPYPADCDWCSEIHAKPKAPQPNWA